MGQVNDPEPHPDLDDGERVRSGLRDDGTYRGELFAQGDSASVGERGWPGVLDAGFTDDSPSAAVKAEQRGFKAHGLESPREACFRRFDDHRGVWGHHKQAGDEGGHHDG
ncbi:MAG: hypothetical protein EBQ56_06295 [Proteobacteria bacterium]|nr:hypothetical protein [Pseudomonadota bacterium]NBX46518.1 hypothetical protein [Chloroflexota bacterium]NBQ32315.1 hypothetical protein [Pseudomonadota bacterium]NBQ63258.1 hypothetical protein [Pseudomonadota bacterium]NBT02716.1 hypothetical protein [Pseudomonadota bacterium]